jgi:cell wall-associated NlpC family hydrolase
MSVYAAREIYRFARLAGFSPDQAVTMTAIAMAESGGNSGAHNPHGEDSRGLWQINARAHPNLGRTNLYDPVQNARAAYEVSGGGRDVSAWTTTHGGTAAPYVSYRAEALAAARASGDSADGVFTGTEGYGHPLTAGSVTGGHTAGTGLVGGPTGAELTGSELPGGGHPAGDGPLHTFLDSALAQQGDPYVWGAETSVSDPNPKAFDCSELIQWAAGRAGVELPDGSWNQYLSLQQQGATISVDKALHTPGALLFSFSSEPTAGGGRPSQAHVAISLGDGHTIEAQSEETGVAKFTAGHRFQYAAVIPGISAGTGLTGPVSTDAATGSTGGLALAAAGSGVDTDHDGLTDALEAQLGLDAHGADSDHDGLSDGYELLKLHTNPLLADSDGDHISDSVEMALGTNPLTSDSDRDGLIDGARNLPGGTADTDHDGLSDMLERLLRTDPTKADSDGDGFTDGAEYRAGYDPASATSNPLAQAAGAAAGTSHLPGTDPVTAATTGLTGTDPTTLLPHPLTAAIEPDSSWGLDATDGLGH